MLTFTFRPFVPPISAVATRPCLIFVTFPLIIFTSIYTAITRLPQLPPLVVAVWVLCTVILLLSLSLTACTDPGVVRR